MKQKKSARRDRPLCPFCNQGAVLKTHTSHYRRGTRVLPVEVKHWECAAECEGPDGTRPFEFEDLELLRKNDAAAREAWRTQFKEEMPPRARPGRKPSEPRRKRVQVLLTDAEYEKLDSERGYSAQSEYFRATLPREAGIERGPFRIDPEEIEGLPERSLVRLANQLLLAEAFSLGIPAGQIKTTVRINDPDGGIDAFTECGSERSDFFTSDLIAWQFKKDWPGPAKLKKELRGRAIQEAFRRGAGYVFLIGKGKPSPSRETLEEKLDAIARDSGCTGRVSLLTGDDLANWASCHPGVVLELRPQLGEYFRASAILNSSAHSVKFEPDESRTQVIHSVLENLLSPSVSAVSARIHGEAGVGKTRLALETVRAAGLEDLTLYAPNPPSLELFAWVTAHPNVRTFVVVDECSDSDARSYEEAAELSGGRLKLLTVGLGSTRGALVYPIGVLETGTLEKVVEAADASLTSERIRWIAAKTRGYVKLAVATAHAVKEGVTKVTEMPHDRDIREVVSKLLMPDWNSQRALQGAALLPYVGCAGGAEAEGKAVAKFMGLKWEDMVQGITPAIQKGLVIRKGKYWRVTPELLAVWLAADVWKAHPDRISQFFESLQSHASEERFLKRLAQLGELPDVRQVLGDLLKEEPFTSVDSLNDGRSSRYLHVIGAGAPEAALEVLERTLGEASTEELRGFSSGRRHVLWLIESLLERRETFFGSARLLRRLAEAENEKLGNNATGIWQALFLTFLGQTEVPALERYVLIEEALGSSEESVRVLGVAAIGSALQDREVGQPVSGEGALPVMRYSPSTWGEVWEIKRKALALLEPILSDRSEMVRTRARETFISHAHSLVAQGLVEEVITWFKRFTPENEQLRRELWETIKGVIRYAKKGLSDDHKRRLEELADQLFGDSLIDRLKRRLGRWSPADWPDGEYKREYGPEIQLPPLADEAVSELGQVRPLLEWMMSGDAEQIWPFARRLGVIDTTHSWYPDLLAAGKGAPDQRLLSGYMRGRTDAGDEKWVEEKFREWMEKREMARSLFDVLWRHEPSDQSAQRILTLIDQGWLPTKTLGCFHIGTWVKGLSGESVEGLLSRLSKAKEPWMVEVALGIAHDWLEVQDHKPSPKLEDTVWTFLENPAGFGGSGMGPYYWKEVAEAFLPRDPRRVMRALIRLSTSDAGFSFDSRGTLFIEALKAAPTKAWEEIGRCLLEDEESYRLAMILEELGVLTHVPVETLLNWAERGGERAAMYLARSTPVKGAELTPLIRGLLKYHSKEAGNTLHCNFVSGMWWGSELEHLRQKLEKAKQWTRDPEEAVRRWARELVDSLEARAKEAKAREEEEELP